MAIRVGINGFGRIGRLVFRAGLSNSNIEFVGINDPFMTPDYCAYMVKYDTVHGRFSEEISFTKDSIKVWGRVYISFALNNKSLILLSLISYLGWLLGII